MIFKQISKLKVKAENTDNGKASKQESALSARGNKEPQFTGQHNTCLRQRAKFLGVRSLSLFSKVIGQWHLNSLDLLLVGLLSIGK